MEGKKYLNKISITHVLTMTSVAEANPARGVIVIVLQRVVELDLQPQRLRCQRPVCRQNLKRCDLRIALGGHDGDRRIEEFLFRVKHVQNGAATNLLLLVDA